MGTISGHEEKGDHGQQPEIDTCINSPDIQSMTSDEEQVAPGAPAHWAVMAGQQVRRVGPNFDPTFYGRKLNI